MSLSFLGFQRRNCIPSISSSFLFGSSVLSFDCQSLLQNSNSYPVRFFAGHSKWKNIQHRKSAQDQQKSKAFAKLGFEIFNAVRGAGTADVALNVRLASAVQRAKSSGMPKENIEKAIAKGLGERDSDSDIQEVFYEGYGPGGVACIIETLTDNRKRTVPRVRHIFSKCGGSLTEQNSVAWMFSRKSMFVFDTISDIDAFMERAIDAGAEDVSLQDDASVCVEGPPTEFSSMRSKLEEAAGKSASSADLVFVPNSHVPLDDDHRESFGRMLEMFDEDEDVQNVYHNAS